MAHRLDYRRVRVLAGEVNALVAQILGAHFPAGVNQQALEAGLVEALETAKGKLNKLRGQIAPPEASNGKE